MSLRRQLLTRRIFLAQGLFAAGAGAWVTWSTSWPARFFRERFKEIGVPIAPAKHRPEPLTWPDDRLTFSWLGHATVLVNFHGVRILVDPALFPRIGVDLTIGSLGPKRLTACALRPTELPEIDLVLVSHAHFDHLDTPSLAAVRGEPAAVMAHGTSDLLPRKRYASVAELRWGESTTVETARGGVRVQGIEVKHWGARVRRDSWRGYCGFIVERDGRRILFGGDTANTPRFADLRAHGPFEAAFMPVGAYDPWIANHCTPEQAIAMANAAGARLVVPIHHQTFRLSREPFWEPLERVQSALATEPDRIPLQEIGQTITV